MTTDTAQAGIADQLKIGDTLTVVSGRLGDAWIAEDDDGNVYTVTPAE
jgi:hypothetical protein